MILAHETHHVSAFAIAPAITSAAVLLFGIFFLLTRFSRTAVATLGLSLAAALWQAAFALMYVAGDAGRARIWAKAGCACVAFIAPALYQFAATLLPPANRRRIIARIGWLAAAQFAILTVVTDHIVTGVRLFWWGFYPTYNGLARAATLLFFGGLLAAALTDIGRAYPSSKGTERKRMLLFGIAMSVGYLAAFDFVPLFGVAMYPFGWVALLGFVALATYTLAKHGTVPITPSLAANEIIGTMRDLLLVSDRDGRIQFANNAACAFLGYASEDLVGRPLEELFVPADGSEPMLQGRWVRDRECIFRTKLGQPIELTLSHSPVRHRGEITGAVIIGRDLRERKRYEWEARRAVTLLQSTLDSTADGILVIGHEGRLLTWNQRFADMWGIPAELMEHEDDQDLIGHLVEQLVDPAEFLTGLAAHSAHPEVESAHLLELKDGRRVEQYSIGRYLDHAPLRVWSFRDVTARLAAEEALRDSEARYRLLFEQNAAGVCLATLSGRIVDCNATFAELVGYAVDELTDRDVRDIFERAAAPDEIRRHLETAPTVRGLEIELRRRDGERVAVLTNVSLLGQGERALVHMTAVDISDRKRAEEQIEFHAYHDALTQLPNRRLFIERLELSILTAKRVRGNVAVLFIDLDRFKTINDTLGHSVADALLIETAERLRSCVRQTDTVARHGGDEFTIILPDLRQPEDAAQVAEKVLECFVQPVAAGATSIELSVSIGIAVYPYDGSDPDTLLRNADDAMYRAKEAGRNGYQLCTEQMKTRAVELSSMQSRLKKAMDDDELVLAYQPLVSVATGLVVGAEAQIRWNDRERGIIEASDFIPMAEETRLIVPLGEWALFTACRQLRRWADSGLPPLRMAVNISARQFQQRDLDRVAHRAIVESGIDPAFLELEIRETTAMRDVDMTADMLARLRNLGVAIGISDFGSAYSSLGSLQVLPIDAVKIDRRFLGGGATAASDTAIVTAIIDVSRTLGLRVAAEGVETRPQLDFLDRRGCQEAQGPYFGPAVDSENFRVLMPYYALRGA